MAHSEFLIGIRELQQHLQDRGWRVVDCRFELSQPEKGFSDYLAGHIPGAVYAHLDRDLAAPPARSGEGSGRHPLPSAEVFARTLGKWGITPATRVVVYDQGGGSIAARLWWMLHWMGHRSVRLLDGGFPAWQRAGLPLSTAVPAVAAVTYEGVADDSMTVSTGEVLEALRSGTPLTLVDARDAARFEGKTEPIDPVAGHIPGARNFPFSTSLTADGSFRSGEDLKKAWSGTLEAAKGRGSGEESRLAAAQDAWAVMCGSGVTACHLALSAGLAGLPAPRLYVGSWSEWIRDVSRPVATGPADADEA
ncbi:MAG TPA: sulfurtransferase [Woeseiaceae bacterium]|nr:sulfurtransferase [Woeseiaceae bacterium]